MDTTLSLTYQNAATAPLERIEDQLQTSHLAGLEPEEATRRLARLGPNTLGTSQVRWWHILGRQFRSSFIYLLVVAAGLAFSLGERVDAVFILGFVLINASLGFYQEFRSEQTLRLLRQYLLPTVRVRRGGADVTIPAKELVVGDIILLEAGDRVPADLRLVRSTQLLVNESTLTGETVGIGKTDHTLTKAPGQYGEATNILFAGTTLQSGSAEGLAVATGKNMVLGSITQLVTQTERVSSFERGISRFSRFILKLILTTLLLVFVANLFLRGSNTNLIELLIFSIALAVSVIPEALPTVTTFSLSRGALQLAKRKVVVKRLSAIEDLGSLEVLCTDKTGTITENILEVAAINSSQPQRTLELAFAAASLPEVHQRVSNNAFDLAIEAKLGAAARRLRSAFRRVAELPFDPDRRRNSVLVQNGTGTYLVVRGAPETVLPCCQLSASQRGEIEAWLRGQGQLGRRTLAIAKKTVTAAADYTPDFECAGLELAGCISFVDPLKRSARHAITQAEKLGVQIKILTGDGPEVAGAVAFQIGLVRTPAEVITGLEFDKLSPDEQHAAVERFAVFARITPAQKYAIVKLLEEKHEVGFLGEGINDAPALKIANVAIAVQGASEIAQEASDIILLKKGLDVIVEGVRQGRAVFSNTAKYIRATLTSNFGNFYAVAFASLLVDYLPMLPIQILVVNLLTDFPMIAIATDSVETDELQTPRAYDVRNIALLATVLGLVSTLFDFMFFATFARFGPPVLQTNWFLGSVLTELLLLFSIRTHRVFWKAQPASVWLTWLTVGSGVLTLSLPYIPLGQRLLHLQPPTPFHLGLILLLCGLYFLTTELTKNAYIRFSTKPTTA